MRGNTTSHGYDSPICKCQYYKRNEERIITSRPRRDTSNIGRKPIHGNRDKKVVSMAVAITITQTPITITRPAFIVDFVVHRMRLPAMVIRVIIVASSRLARIG